MDQITSVFGESVDLYRDVLQIPTDSDASKIRQAYFNKCLSCHPDKVDDGETAENKEILLRRFYALSAAYEILSDSSKREAYDQEKSSYLESSSFGYANSPRTSETSFSSDDEGLALEGRGLSRYKRAKAVFKKVYKMLYPEKCVKCRKEPQTYECMPCGCQKICRGCAMKLATGGKCKSCGSFFVSCRQLRG